MRRGTAGVMAVAALAVASCAGVVGGTAASWDPLSGSVGQATRPIPPRLDGVPQYMVDTVNDWHYAMMSDWARNDAYKGAIREAVGGKGGRVLDVGAGSGLLSLMAAREGAETVYAVEASGDLARVAQRIAADNRQHVGDKIQFVEQYSTEVSLATIDDAPVDVLVSETLGTFLLGEDALVYMADARDRLLKPGGDVIPAGGVQHVTAISSEALSQITRVSANYDGYDLSHFNALIDNSVVLFSKRFGMRVSDLAAVDVSPPLPIYTVDFYNDTPESFAGRVARPVVLPFRAQCTCTIHALVYHWEAWLDRERHYTISTYHGDTRHNIPRDIAWGQAVQIVVVESDDGTPAPFEVTRGEALEVHIADAGNVALIRGVVKRAGRQEEL